MVGTIIGASVFVQASEITAHVPTAAGVVLAWLLAGVLTLLGALVCAELASAFPRTGGVYVFLREIYSPALGFLWGWGMFWSMHSGIAAAIATVFARYAGTFLSLGDTATRMVAVGAILVLSGINYVGTRTGSRLQAVITGVKVAAVAAIIGAGWWLAPSSVAASAAAGPTGTWDLTGLMLAVSAGLFAFGGWHMVTYTAEETVDAARTIPRALMIGIVVVTVCYIGLNTVYLRVLTVPEVIASPRVAADTFNRLVGPAGAVAISALVMVSAFGALNGIILVGPRVYYQMAQDGVLFAWAGEAASDLPDPGARHRAAGGVVVRAGVDRHLPRALHARDLHGVDFLCAAGHWYLDAEAPPRIPSGVAHAARADRTAALRRRFSRDRRQPGGRRPARSRHRPGAGRLGPAGLLAVDTNPEL